MTTCKLCTSFNNCNDSIHTANGRSLLNEMEFVKHMIEHLVEKLASTDKDNKRATELLHGLSVFCTYKEVPIKKNQSMNLLYQKMFI